MKRALLLIALLATAACKKQKAPEAKRIWMGPNGGCMQTLPHPKTGELACWGALPGDKTPASFAVKRDFSGLTDFAIGARIACGVRGGREVDCWTDQNPTPTKTEDTGEALAVRAGAAHACVRSSDVLRCFGAAGDWLGKPGDWNRNTKIKAFALGAAHTCAAYENLGVMCRGDADAAGDEAALAKIDAVQLAAGDHHTCALQSNHSVVCWGKNDAGQLGDQTTTDSKVPVNVLGLGAVAALAAGRAHTCALLSNGTVFCWGANDHHQLANGDVKASGRAAMVLGVLGVSELAAAGNGSCARLFSTGEVRCWGENDAAQLGDASRVEHTVPDAIRFQ